MLCFKLQLTTIIIPVHFNVDVFYEMQVGSSTKVVSDVNCNGRFSVTQALLFYMPTGQI